MEKNHIKIKAAVLLSVMTMAAVLSSCEREAIDGNATAQQDGIKALGFTPSIASLPRISDEPATRATLINEDGTEPSLSTSAEFYVAGWDMTGEAGSETLTPAITAFEKVKYVTGSATSHVNMWITVDGSKIIEHRWKSGEKKLFYAYSGTSSESVTLDDTDPGSPVLNVVCSLASQTDVLMGYGKGDGTSEVETGGSTETKMTGTASVLFHHPLAAVEFEVGTIIAPKDSFKITGITMEGLYSEGTASMDNTGAITWSGCSGEGSVSQTVSTMPSSGRIGEAFLAIPQTFTSDSSRVVISATMGKKPISLHILLKGKTLTAGAVTKYSINYDAHRGIQLWEDGPYWAQANVGADYPEDYGWFFSWGNVDGYVPTNSTTDTGHDYTMLCVWSPKNGGPAMPKGFDTDYYRTTKAYKELFEATGTVQDIDAAHDAATKIMGAGWRMPTNLELQALITNTVQTHTVRAGHEGYLFTGKGAYKYRSIFLPLTGYGEDNGHVEGDYSATYRSSIHHSVGYNTEIKTWDLWLHRAHGSADTDAVQMEEGFAYLGGVIRAVENF